MTQDEEHLRLLSIFHYVVGGLAALFSFFPLLYGALGLLLLNEAVHPKHGQPPPYFIGWLLIGFGCFFFLLGLTFAFCVAFSGCFIARHRLYYFSFVMACIECLCFSFETGLGIFTILVLSRQSVKGLCGIEAAPVSASSKV